MTGMSAQDWLSSMSDHQCVDVWYARVLEQTNCWRQVFSGITLTKLIGISVLALTRSKLLEVTFAAPSNDHERDADEGARG